MRRASFSYFGGWGVLWLVLALANSAMGEVSFRRDVAPILLKQCQGCHGAEKSKGKFRLDSFERLMKAGESKDAPVAAGKPGASAIYRLITAKDEDDRMPQKADPLPAAQSQASSRPISTRAIP